MTRPRLVLDGNVPASTLVFPRRLDVLASRRSNL